jgi:diacylglycerol kinase family enzyme
MNPKKNLVFIVNPKAGVTPKNKTLIELIADNTIPASKYNTTVLFTEYAGHATELALQ